MRLGPVAAVIAAGTLWRTTGARAAGRRLVAALDDADVQIAELAGMLLVKAGTRSLPLLGAALESNQSPGPVLRVLASIDPSGQVAVFEQYRHDARAEVATAARDGLTLASFSREQDTKSP